MLSQRNWINLRFTIGSQQLFVALISSPLAAWLFCVKQHFPSSWQSFNDGSLNLTKHVSISIRTQKPIYSMLHYFICCETKLLDKSAVCWGNCAITNPAIFPRTCNTSLNEILQRQPSWMSRVFTHIQESELLGSRVKSKRLHDHQWKVGRSVQNCQPWWFQQMLLMWSTISNTLSCQSYHSKMDERKLPNTEH